MSRDLVVPGPPSPPRTGRLLDADGRTLRTFTRHAPATAKLIPLDADGRPCGAPRDLPVTEIIMTTDGTVPTMGSRWCPGCGADTARGERCEPWCPTGRQGSGYR